MGAFVHGLRAASDRQLHDWWYRCLHVGADCTAEAIQREMARRYSRPTHGEVA
jgi:hypothetical protein